MRADPIEYFFGGHRQARLCIALLCSILFVEIVFYSWELTTRDGDVQKVLPQFGGNADAAFGRKLLMMAIPAGNHTYHKFHSIRSLDPAAATAFSISRKSQANAPRTRIGPRCSKDDVLIFQGPTAPLPSGIPTYTVDILNVCAAGDCSISNVHVTCGWFSSARLINPRVFRRVCFNDCLVNDGEAMSPGQSLSFQYANTHSYSLSVSSVSSVSCH